MSRNKIVLLTAAALISLASPVSGQGLSALDEVAGALDADGGAYRIAKPANWNGVLILDLDFAARPDSPLYKRMHELGYAGAGSTRGDAGNRGTAVDNPARIKRQLEVLRLFEQRFGKPKRVISFGLSGAGGLALALVEAAPEHIDGGVAACIITGSVGWFNAKLDSAFVAKTLIAPGSDLRLQDMPRDLTPVSQAWTQMLEKAQATPEGRARIALAVTIGQLPSWSRTDTLEPAAGDLPKIQQAMYETLVSQFGATIGGHVRVRRDFEESAGGTLSWNTDIDYRKILEENADPAQRDAVRQLYQIAGLDLDADLQMLRRAPRETANPAAVIKADSLMGVTAKPRNPLMLLHTSGDSLAPAATLEAYIRRAPATLVRTAIVQAAGHCTFSIAESMAAIETVDRRIATNLWPATSSVEMNARARAADVSPARFMDFHLNRFARAFYTGDAPPAQ